MARIRLSDPVRLDDGTVTTCAALLASGKAYLEKIEHFGRTDRTAYFVSLVADRDDERGLAAGWEINRLAYESRMGNTIKLGS